MVSRGLAPLHVLQAATINAAELIEADDRGLLAPGLLADIIGVPGDPLQDITVTWPFPRPRGRRRRYRDMRTFYRSQHSH